MGKFSYRNIKRVRHKNLTDNFPFVLTQLLRISAVVNWFVFVLLKNDVLQ